MALIRLRQKYVTSVYDLLVKDYTPETTASIGTWTNVTFNNTIDMATGNYRLTGYESNEAGETLSPVP
jgi:hypothetical protein